MAKQRSALGSILFAYAMFQQYFSTELRDYMKKYWNQLLCYFSPYIKISIHEYSPNSCYRSEAYTAVEIYLSTKSSTRASRLKADVAGENGKNLVFSMDDYEGITDVYQGVVVWWHASKSVPNTQTISYYPADDKWFFKLKFHRKHRDFVMGTYMSYVMEQGKAIKDRNRQIKLHTNNPGQKSWTHVVFDHPARFENLAMDPVKKQEIMDDLLTFSKAKDYYAKVGKACKRGYLLYGPPGTGKSTTIAAIANFLNYDIYDLELTAVKENNELRKLLIGTSNKSILVIEDIDCSLDLTGQRKKKVKKTDDDDKEKNPILKKAKEEAGSSSKESKVTLSGLLNVIDGLWSACGKERIIIFTTNYVEKLDPALIRRGRMDKHIELSYCGFEGFKVLAKNYLDIDSHPLFDTIRELIEETPMTPADIAENLIPKTVGMDAPTCLESLIQALQNAKKEAKLKKKAEEEAKLKKDEEEARLKEETEDKEEVEESDSSSNEHEDEESDSSSYEDEDEDSDSSSNEDEDEDSDEDEDEDSDSSSYEDEGEDSDSSSYDDEDE